MTEHNPSYDLNYTRHVGWNLTDESARKFFSKETVNLISKKITQLTLGVDSLNRPIVVPKERITEVMDGVYSNWRPQVGDIYSRHIVPNERQKDFVESLINQTIEIITDTITNEFGMIEANSKLSAWVQLYGDFNPHNLNQTPQIKIKHKRPSSMQFNMNY